MTDIVNRLRAEGANAMRNHLSMGMSGLCADAAAEIERLQTWNANAKEIHAAQSDEMLELRDEIERLRAELEIRIGWFENMGAPGMAEATRRALAEQGGKK